MEAEINARALRVAFDVADTADKKGAAEGRAFP